MISPSRSSSGTDISTAATSDAGLRRAFRERIALVEEVTLVRDVRRGQRQRVHLHSRAGANVERRVRAQMRRTVAVQKSRTVIDVRSDPGGARKSEPHSSRQRVTLIVIEEKPA